MGAPRQHIRRLDKEEFLRVRSHRHIKNKGARTTRLVEGSINKIKGARITRRGKGQNDCNKKAAVKRTQQHREGHNRAAEKKRSSSTLKSRKWAVRGKVLRQLAEAPQQGDGGAQAARKTRS